MAIISTDPADFAPAAQAGRVYGLANNGTAGAAAATGLLGLVVVDQGNGVAPGLGYRVLFVAAADRPSASHAGMLASGGPTAEVGDVR
jgi:hypothetical protein